MKTFTIELTQKEAEYLKKYLTLDNEDLDFTGMLDLEEGMSIHEKVTDALERYVVALSSIEFNSSNSIPSDNK